MIFYFKCRLNESRRLHLNQMLEFSLRPLGRIEISLGFKFISRKFISKTGYKSIVALQCSRHVLRYYITYHEDRVELVYFCYWNLFKFIPRHGNNSNNTVTFKEMGGGRNGLKSSPIYSFDSEPGTHLTLQWWGYFWPRYKNAKTFENYPNTVMLVFIWKFFQSSSHVPGFRSYFSIFATILLTKLSTSSERVKHTTKCPQPDSYSPHLQPTLEEIHSHVNIYSATTDLPRARCTCQFIQWVVWCTWGLWYLSLFWTGA